MLAPQTNREKLVTLQLRVYALYNRNRSIGLLLAGTCTICFGAMVGITAKVLTDVDGASQKLHDDMTLNYQRVCHVSSSIKAFFPQSFD